LPFSVGAVGLPRVLVCIEGGGEIEQGYATYTVEKGEVLFLPAAVGLCTLWPRGAVNLLEIALLE
jgi:mannose-6-phosphate isomerase